MKKLVLSSFVFAATTAFSAGQNLVCVDTKTGNEAKFNVSERSNIHHFGNFSSENLGLNLNMIFYSPFVGDFTADTNFRFDSYDDTQSVVLDKRITLYKHIVYFLSGNLNNMVLTELTSFYTNSSRNPEYQVKFPLYSTPLKREYGPFSCK